MSYRRSLTSSGAALTMGVIFPALTIAIEWCTGLCADTFFDPVPTLGHLALVFAVPMINALLFRALGGEEDPGPWLIMAGGAALAIAGSYALIFLSILPIALLGLVLFGLGLLPFAPLFAGIFAYNALSDLSLRVERLGRRAAAGFAVGLVLLVLVDLPAMATWVALNGFRGDDADKRSAVRLMRTLGDREMLLRISYGANVRPGGLASAAASIWSDGFFADPQSDSGQARDLYYRTTGIAFSAVPRPEDRKARGRWFGWDEDQGGNQVGGRVSGLTLATSRIDGSVAAADNLAYVEWTIAIANHDGAQHEGRFTLALPEGAVATRATLWVNGEPREASIAGRGAVREAYQSVVQASRDPLLVTTAGAQRLLVQAFPIPAGSALRLRIGYTAPFVIAPNGRRTLALPAMAERNFEVPAGLRHRIWFEGDTLIASAEPALQNSARIVKGDLADADLTDRRPRILLPHLTGPSVRVGGVPATGKAPPLAIVQTIAHTPPRPPSGLMIVLDGSIQNRPAGEALAAALDGIPLGVPVGLSIAADMPLMIEPAPWSTAQRQRMIEAIRNTSFEGGQDNGPALAAALARLPDPQAQILWVHGPQPVSFDGEQDRIRQLEERRTSLPGLVRYQAKAGRAFAIERSRWFETARLASPSGDPRRDLAEILSTMSGAVSGWSVEREAVPGAAVTGSAHIVRLWGADRIAARAGESGKAAAEAVQLANRLNLVTPLSGAVVLETDSDYKENGLPVPAAEDVPTVPEPGEWALLAALALAALWIVRRRRQGLA